MTLRISGRALTDPTSGTTFFDSIHPPLAAGDYTLNATQTVTAADAALLASYTFSQPFQIAGPQFSLQPSDIHMMYPPPSQSGDFSGALPNVTFTNFALPWLRGIDPAAPQTPTSPPWMAVLTVYAAEMPSGDTPQVAVPVTSTAGALVHPDDATVLGPALTIDATDPTPVQTIDMKLAFFRGSTSTVPETFGIAPSLADLPFLAHAREVSTANKIDLGLAADGAFSVLLSNRVAPSAADGTTAAATAYLVSVEGHQAHLPGGPPIPATFVTIRLAVLASWSFQTAPATAATFIALMENLDAAGNGGTAMLSLPQAAITDLDPTAKEALQIGFVPLQNLMRVGERSTSWYRGPFVAAPTAPSQAYGPFHSSDHAMQYDPATGVFNHAYAAAWQIGRLLALADSSFGKWILAWRTLYFNQIAASATQAALAPHLATLQRPNTPANARLRTRLLTFLAGRFHPQSSLANRQLTPRGAQPTPVQPLFNPEETASLRQSGEDPLLALKKKLAERGPR